MKLKIVTTIILSILAFGAIGQINQKSQIEIGITYNPTFTNSQKYERSYALNFSTGILENIKFFKRLGIGIGIEYQKQNINTIELVNCDPLGHPFYCESPSQDKFEIAKIPVWVNLNLNYKSNPKIKTDLIGGYGFGKLLNSKEKETEFRLHGLIDNLHFGLIGIEFQKS